MTATPAKLLGLADRGQIAPGFVADMVLLTPGLQVVKTIVGGQVC
ncbi:MAG: amidohydrolase family protein [Chloroflexota bacterium]